MNLNNKHIVLTGATGGIGEALAAKLDACGATLYLVGRNKVKLAEIESALTQTHLTYSVDLNSDTDRNAFISDLKNSLAAVNKNLDMVINLAGISTFSLLEDTTDDAINNLLETNLLTPIKLTRKLLPLLCPSHARIINVGSTLGAIGYPGYCVYSASKFGLRGFSEALRRELSDSTIKVQYIAPRATQTSLNSHAVNRMNKTLGNSTDSVDTVAQEIMRSISNNKEETNIGLPEKLFIWINAISTQLVSKAIQSNLSQIKHFAREQ